MKPRGRHTAHSWLPAILAGLKHWAREVRTKMDTWSKQRIDPVDVSNSFDIALQADKRDVSPVSIKLWSIEVVSFEWESFTFVGDNPPINRRQPLIQGSLYTDSFNASQESSSHQPGAIIEYRPTERA